MDDFLDQQNNQWLSDDDSGQLAVDVYEDKDNIIIKSTVAGVTADNLDISFHNDMITIHGKRSQEEEVVEDKYYYKECFWGNFSRSIILPCEVKKEKIKATLKNGILKIILPKAKKSGGVSIKIKEE